MPQLSHSPAPGRLNVVSQPVLAWRDLTESLRMYRFWLMLGWNDTKEHYRGSILGPFWLTITTGIFVAGLGPLYASLFSLDMADYLPRMALGISVWGFINGTINEACNTFIASAHIIKQVRLPRLALLFRVILKNVINFVHISPVYFVVLFCFHVPNFFGVLLALFGFLVLCLNLIWIGLLVAILCARYRDIAPIVGSVMQICFFVTPIMWNHNQHVVNSIIL